jgi:hypothetical protein
MTPFFTACVTIAISFAAFFVLFNLFNAKSQLPIGFGSWEELEAVGGVARWASEQVGRDDPRYRTLFRLGLRDTYYRVRPPIRGRGMSQSELEILAPFIDETIEGKGGPWPLPAEYDHRSEDLNGVQETYAARRSMAQERSTIGVIGFAKRGLWKAALRHPRQMGHK